MSRFRVAITLAAMVLTAESAAAVTLDGAFTTIGPSDEACNPAVRKSAFQTTDAAVWLYVSVSNAAAGDQLAIDWIRPDGTVYRNSTSSGLPEAGNWCFDNKINIAGESAAQYPGNWVIRGYWNGSPFFATNFTISLPTAACIYSIDPTTRNLDAAGGSGQVAVTTTTGCQWTAARNVSWIAITSGSSGTGNGSVTYSVDANTTASSRTGIVTIADRTHTVIQAAATCNYLLNPASASVPASGGAGTVNVTAGAACQWTAQSGATWLHITSGGSSTGSGTVAYNADSNSATAARSSTITVADKTFALQQAGASASSGPAITEDGIFNAASYASALRDGAARGSLISIFGRELARSVVSNDKLPIPSELGGTRVDVIQSGVTRAAYLLYVSPGQINMILPSALDAGAAEIVVSQGGKSSIPAPIRVVNTKPGIFFSAPAGREFGIIQQVASQTDYPLNTLDRPAKPNQTAILWATGLGAVAGRDDTPPAGGNLPVLVNAYVGGREAKVLYGGRAPGFPGVDVIYVEVPPDVQFGCYVAVNVVADGIDSNVVAMAVTSQGQACIPPADPVERVMGPAGGTISAGNAAVVVPAGAIANTTTLRIVPFSDGAQTAGGSGLYRIEGLPLNASKPLTVSVAVDPTMDLGGEAFLLVRPDGDTESGPIKIKATRKGNVLEAVLPALRPFSQISQSVSTMRSAAAAATPVSTSTWISARTGFTTRESAAGNFVAHFEVSFAGNDAALKKYVDYPLSKAEESRGMIGGLGVDLSKRKKPVDIWMISFRQTEGRIFLMRQNNVAVADSAVGGVENMGVNLNTDELVAANGAQSAPIFVSHELLHVFQSLYIPAGTIQQSFSESTWLWMLEATATWFEGRIAYDTNPNYFPDVVQTNQIFPFLHGLEYPPDSTAASLSTQNERQRRHGYGASLFVRYLVNNEGYGNKLVGRWFDRLAETTAGTPVNATATAGLEREVSNLELKWLRFIRALCDRQVRPEVGLDTLLAALTKGQPPVVRPYVVASDADNGTSVSWQSQALSARMMILQFPSRTTQWPADTRLKITLGQTQTDAEGIIYVRAAGHDTIMAGTLPKYGGTFEYAGVRDLAQNGGLVYIVVADGGTAASHTGVTSLTVDVQISSGLTVLLERKNQGPGDYTPGISTEWIIEGQGARVAPPGSFTNVFVSSPTVNVRVRVRGLIPPPNFKGCYNDICTQFDFEGFTDGVELWCGVLLATSSGSGWMEGRNIALVGKDTYGWDRAEFYVKVFYRFHYKQWEEKTGKVLVDENKDTDIREFLSVERH